MRKCKWIGALFISTICMTMMAATVFAKDVGIKITAPSDKETNIVTGRSFYVLGTFDAGAELQDGDEVRVELKDASGTVVRTVSTTIMNNTNAYIDYPGLSYYGDDINELLDAGMPELLWDGKDEKSFHNGDIKLYYNDHEFAALLSGGEGEISEQTAFVDASGNPYELLKDGAYTISVTVTDNTDAKKDDSDVTGTAEKQITIGADADKILSRFSPAAHRDRLTAFAEQNNYKVYTDLFPGYWSKGDIFCEILPEWRAADASEYLQGKVHFVIYNVKESSATYSVEVATMQTIKAIEDPDRIQCYYYEYGEPVLPDAAKTGSEIVPFDAGDKLQLYRAETFITDTEDNVYIQDDPQATAYDLNVSDGIDANVGETIAVYGVATPIQIDAADIVDNGDNSYKLNNKISTLQYHITGDGIDETLKKEVNLNRKSGDWDNYSTLEFKHDIPITEDMLGKSLTVEIVGVDAHGTQVEGTAEQFTIAVSNQAAAAAPATGDTNIWILYVMLIGLAGITIVVILKINMKKIENNG
ncbi:MAG: hypothetical protein Q4G60_09860 [bacterium]|nr:hypothetical protein [bacterium]